MKHSIFIYILIIFTVFSCKTTAKPIVYDKNLPEIRKELRYTVKFLHNLPDSTLEQYRKNEDYQRKIFPIVEKYDKFIENAHPTLKKIYKFLYVEGLTQKDAAYYLYYSEKYVQRKNKELILYFQKCFG